MSLMWRAKNRIPQDLLSRRTWQTILSSVLILISSASGGLSLWVTSSRASFSPLSMQRVAAISCRFVRYWPRTPCIAWIPSLQPRILVMNHTTMSNFNRCLLGFWKVAKYMVFGFRVAKVSLKFKIYNFSVRKIYRLYCLCTHYHEIPILIKVTLHQND